MYNSHVNTPTSTYLYVTTHVLIYSSSLASSLVDSKYLYWTNLSLTSHDLQTGDCTDCLVKTFVIF